MPEAESNQVLKIFLSYAQDDEKGKNMLLEHLSPLKRQGLIESWDNRQIGAGSERRQEILKHFNAADLILCLISSSFINSEYCYTVEMRLAWERRETKGVMIVPILLRTVNWQTTPFKELEIIPRDHRAIMDYPKRDKAFTEVVYEIEKVINALNRKKT